MTCTFFGHGDCPPAVFQKLKSTIENLIVTNGATSFLVGNQGNFDALAQRALKELQELYPKIDYCVVLAYLKNDIAKTSNYDTVFPEGIESVPPKFAIDFRNKWMVNKSDYVITYITRSFGGAAKFAELARKKKKYV